MRLSVGWGRQLAEDAERWTRVPATARLGDLHGSSNGLRPARHRAQIDASGHDRARAALLAFEWFPPRFLRQVVASDGVTVLQRCRLGPLSVDAPVRIAEHVVEPMRVSIALVTVQGHPERGVERYELVLDAALGAATLTVEKAWDLADPLARAAAPFSTWLQAHATRASIAHLTSARRA